MRSRDGATNTIRWRTVWVPTLLHAVSSLVIVLALYYYWFALADRYIIFLYFHDMGPRFPDTSPFSAVTSSRYWLAGLVAAGIVMVFFTAVNWLLGRSALRYRAPEWWRVWVLCAVPLLIGIPAITMSVNQPTLLWSNVAQTTLAAWLGLALALMPAKLAAERPLDLVWLAFDGVAMALILLHLSMLEDVGRWWISGNTWRVWIVVLGFVAGLAGLLVMTGLRRWRHVPCPNTLAVFIAGLCFAYLLLPLVHHLYVTIADGYMYISNAANFFASSVPSQSIVWLVAATIALAVTRLRNKLDCLHAAEVLS